MKNRVLPVWRNVLVTVSAAVCLSCGATPARAIIVYDPANYAQNVLQAARSLQQITHQIESLQNQATMIEGMVRNLDHLDFSSLARMTGALDQISRLMGQAQGISFQFSQTEAQFEKLFPGSARLLAIDPAIQAADQRFETERNAFAHSMSVQSQITDGASQDAQTLSDLVTQSQSAHGSLQAQQAANQLLALTAKQQIAVQAMLAAQSRASAIQSAIALQAQTDGQAATRRFLGTGHAYTPLP
jgi:type IV secretion system protein TrbJ